MSSAASQLSRRLASLLRRVAAADAAASGAGAGRASVTTGGWCGGGQLNWSCDSSSISSYHQPLQRLAGLGSARWLSTAAPGPGDDSEAAAAAAVGGAKTPEQPAVNSSSSGNVAGTNHGHHQHHNQPHQHQHHQHYRNQLHHHPFEEQQGGEQQQPQASAPPFPTFEELLAAERDLLRGSGTPAPDDAKRQLSAALKRFSAHSAVRDRALAVHVSAELFPRAAAAFRKFCLRGATPALCAAVVGAGGAGGGYGPRAEAGLFALFERFCRQQFGAQLDAHAAAVAALDLRAPHSWYPYARAIKRRIVYHGGPTNSGKTHSALEALAAARRGVYCGPLRLLAMEVYERLNAGGVRCDMVTGQEVLRVPGAGHVSCTVEMVALNAHADVAVLDEIQMLGDPQRGFAWTRALLGLPANELHVCGDLSAVGLVRHIAAECGDEFELRTYDRMTPLVVDEDGLPNGWADVRPGDCVIAFGRAAIYNIRKEVEAASGERACIVYGALPAETRRAQARLFNDPDSGHRVLVASDAIGMGLNFNIGRVVFSTMLKSGGPGHAPSPLPASLVKQIAGRAGRRGSDFPVGRATVARRGQLRALKEALALPPEALHTPAAGLAPEFEMFELLASQVSSLSVEQLLHKFESEARLDGTYFFCNPEGLALMARLLRGVPDLSLKDRFTFCLAPVNTNDELVKAALQEFAHSYASGQPVVLDPARMPSGPPKGDEELAHMESLYRVLSLWMWLSLRFDESCFPGRDRAKRMMTQLCDWMNHGLALREGGGEGSGSGSGSRHASESGGGSSRRAHHPRGGAAARARLAARAVDPEAVAARRAALAAERLLAPPAFDPSMSRFVRWSNAPRLVVPPPPPEPLQQQQQQVDEEDEEEETAASGAAAGSGTSDDEGDGAERVLFM